MMDTQAKTGSSQGGIDIGQAICYRRPLFLSNTVPARTYYFPFSLTHKHDLAELRRYGDKAVVRRHGSVFCPLFKQQ